MLFHSRPLSPPISGTSIRQWTFKRAARFAYPQERCRSSQFQFLEMAVHSSGFRFIEAVLPSTSPSRRRGPSCHNRLSLKCSRTEDFSLNWNGVYTDGLEVRRLNISSSEVTAKWDELASVYYRTGNEHEETTQLGLGDHYVPEIGHRVLGVVVSGSRTKFEVDIGAAKLGELKVSKLFPLERFQVKRNKWLFPDEVDVEDRPSKAPYGRPSMVYDEEVFAYDDPALFVVDIGTVLEMVVIDESPNGNPILSARKAAERIAWDRVKQIKALKQPILIEVIDYNLSGVIARVEGLRAFLPLKEFINRPKTLEDYIGRKLWVTINFVDEDCHSLIISERKAWVKRNLWPGSLHNGTVLEILPYGVRVQVNRTNIMGLIHISNIAHGLIEKITEVLEVGEQIKMMVVKSDNLNMISFSTADLESESGLMLRDKQRVFQEAERTAHAWWIENGRRHESCNDDVEDLSCEVAHEPIANLDWLDFRTEKVSLPSD